MSYPVTDQLCVSLKICQLTELMSYLKLVDGHTLFDYSVGLNDLIQLMIRAPPPAQETKEKEKNETTENGSDKENEVSHLFLNQHKFRLTLSPIQQSCSR